MFNFEKLTENMKNITLSAQGIAKTYNNSMVEVGHILLAAAEFDEDNTKKLLNLLNIGSSVFKEDAKKIINTYPQIQGNVGQLYFSQNLLKTFDGTEDEAKQLKDKFITFEHFLLSMEKNPYDTIIQKLLAKYGLTRVKILNAMKTLRGNKKVEDKNSDEDYNVLDKYTDDFTAYAEQGKLDPVIGRDEEIRRIIQILNRRSKNNPVLIGEPGVGKTAIVEGLAQRIIRGD